MLYHNLIDLKDFQIMYTECTLLFGIRQEQIVWLYWDLLFRAIRDCSNLLRQKSHLLCLLLFLISVTGLKFQSHILYIENWEKQWHHCMQNQQLKRGYHGIQGFFLPMQNLQKTGRILCVTINSQHHFSSKDEQELSSKGCS